MCAYARARVCVCVCERERVSESAKISSDYILDILGTRCLSWLRHFTTSRQVAGSIPDGVIGIFHLRNLSGRTVALELAQLVTEMSTRDISWGVKAAGA